VSGPSALPGRAEESQRILDRLSRAAAGTGACVIIDGAQKMGKTRLLAETVRAARAGGFAVSSPPALPATLAAVTGLVAPAERPLLVAVDDVAVETLIALSPAELGRAVSATGAVLALTVNTAAAGPALRGVLAVPQPRVDYLRLGPLDRESVEALAAGLLGAPPGPRLRELLPAAGGSPWLATELVEGLRDEGGVIGVELVPDAPLPGRVHAAVQSRMSTLPARAVHLVWIAAAIGRTLAVGELTAVLGENTVTLLPAVDEVLRSGLLVTDRDRLAFPGELVWRVVLDSIPLSVRASLSEDVRTLRAPARTAGPGLVVTGGAAPRGPTTADASLTEQERRIAGLVGSGLTNQQVARRLYLSPHTVNYHLRTIFRKLDIASRVELARFADLPAYQRGKLAS
jgi:DNA-binding CsgD family transcriptional regulator